MEKLVIFDNGISNIAARAAFTTESDGILPTEMATAILTGKSTCGGVGGAVGVLGLGVGGADGVLVGDDDFLTHPPCTRL